MITREMDRHIARLAITLSVGYFAMGFIAGYLVRSAQVQSAHDAKGGKTRG